MTAGDGAGTARVNPTAAEPAAGTAPADPPDETPAPAARRRVRSETVGDLVITLVLLALSGWAYVEANEWSERAALFPHLVSGSTFVLAALYLVQVLVRLRRELTGPREAADGAAAQAAAHDASGHLLPGTVAAPHGSEDDVSEDDVEYVFQTAGARRWAAALAWIAFFFVMLFVAGLYITAPLFSLLYLRFAGRRTWLFSGIYAVVVGVVLYLAFEVALAIPTPPGLFLD